MLEIVAEIRDTEIMISDLEALAAADSTSALWGVVDTLEARREALLAERSAEEAANADDLAYEEEEARLLGLRVRR